MKLKIINLEVLKKQLKKLSKHNDLIYNHNHIINELIKDIEEHGSISYIYHISYGEDENGNKLKGTCIFALDRFKILSDGNEKITFYYEGMVV